jgi:hypothetical protein
MQSCKIFWINIYIHRVIKYGNGANGYNSSIDRDIMTNLNSSFNQYGFYFELIGARDWVTDIYSDPESEGIVLSGIFDDPGSLQHTDAIDIYLLPSDSQISGGFVPSNNKKVMVIGGTRTIQHCSGSEALYEVVTTKVVSHEMGHCLGLPHTFDVSLGTSVDYVTENACIDPGTCQFVSNCTNCNVSSNPTLNMNNFMSYTVPSCMSVFSDEQVSLMRQTLDNTMTPVVDRTQGEPADIIGDLLGPSEVSKGLIVPFYVTDQADQSESFIWTIPPGFLRTGEDDSNGIVQTWIGSTAESGNVRVVKTNLCGTSREKFKYVTVTANDCTGCPSVKVFPNPAFSEIYISYSSQESGDQEFFEKDREYMVVDAEGKIVHNYKSKQTNLILDLKPIKAGVYTLVIKHGNPGTFQHKFIIAR